MRAQTKVQTKVTRWLAYPVVFVAILLLFSVTNRDWVPNVAPFSTLSHSSSNKAVSDGVIAVDGVYVAFTLGKLYALAQSKCSDELIETKGFVSLF